MGFELGEKEGKGDSFQRIWGQPLIINIGEHLGQRRSRGERAGFGVLKRISNIQHECSMSKFEDEDVYVYEKG